MIFTILFLIHLLFLINTKFTLWPEMVVYPYLLNHGFLLYRDIVNPYPPLLTYSLAVFSNKFGYQPLPYQILTWSIILITDILIYKIASRIFSQNKAILSIIFFAFLSIPFGINGLWFDLVQIPFILLSIYYALRFLEKTSNSQNLIYSQLFLTVAFLIKQQSIWLEFLYFAVLLIKLPKKRFINLASLFLILPAIFLGFELISFSKVLPDFVFWTTYFPFVKASQIPGYILLPTTKQILITCALIILFVPQLFKKDQKLKFITSCGLVSLLFAYPRFDYFHLTPSLAILSLVISSIFNSFTKLSNLVKLIILTDAVILVFFSARYFKNNWTHEVRFFEDDIYKTAAFVKTITKSDEPIYIQNGPDQILPLAGRLPTKPWVDDFPWYLEITGMQDKVTKGITSQNSKHIISKPYDSGDKFELGSYRPTKIADVIDSNYQNTIQITSTLWLKSRK